MKAMPGFALTAEKAPRPIFGRALLVAALLHLLVILLPGSDLLPRTPEPVVLDLVLERVPDRPPLPQQLAPIEQPQSAVADTVSAAEPRSEPEPATETARPAPPRDRPRLNLDLTGLDRALEQQDATSRIGRLTGGATRSAEEAAYLRAWRQRVERIGNANYPGGGVEGQLRMLVVINADGTLVDARLLTSSGVPALDAAALRIVRLSAPFPAFPVELRRRFDQLEILRSWQFTRRGARIEH
ncbi:MAG: hypothetical protein RL756_1495 [Pseudomonadota bacterium]